LLNAKVYPAVVDGAIGAKLLAAFKQLMENPMRMLVGQ
jgi:pyruvate/2-oxoglutarate dehydrogenase complex dihydrolipoamide acyltransferase (E2) component